MKVFRISRAGVVLGEYDESTIRRCIDAGSIKLDDFGFTDGMSDWRPLHELGFKASQSVYALQAMINAGQAKPAYPKKKTRAYFGWLIAAFFAPFVCSWRILFDKNLGYPRGVKCFYAFWTMFVFAMVVRAASEVSHTDGSQDMEYRMAHPYDVKGNQERPMAAGGVIDNAENLVKGVLKAPSTARFSEYRDTDWEKTYDDFFTQYYVVDGWVESQNSFGAILRNRYIICYSVNGKTATRHFVRLGSDDYGVIPDQCRSAFK
jgi:hypothetical protein